MKNENCLFLLTSLHKPRYYTDHACILLRMLLDVLLYIRISDSIFGFKICKWIIMFGYILLNSFKLFYLAFLFFENSCAFYYFIIKLV